MVYSELFLSPLQNDDLSVAVSADRRGSSTVKRTIKAYTNPTNQTNQKIDTQKVTVQDNVMCNGKSLSKSKCCDDDKGGKVRCVFNCDKSNKCLGS
jgi:hypothetical protein